MKRLLIIALTALVSMFTMPTMAQNAKQLIDIDPSSFRPVQTGALSGVAIDKIAPDRSKRPCARIKIHVNRMSREDIDRLEVKVIGGNVELTRKQTAYEGNGLVIELTAKEQTRFYLHHEKYGDSNEVMLNLEGNKEYSLKAHLNLLMSIAVATNVIGADVYLDKNYKGVTDENGLLTIEEVSSGKHLIMIKHGMIIDEREVEVSSSRISFRLTITDPATVATSAAAPATSATTATTASATSVSSVNAAPDALPQIEMVFVKGGRFKMGATAEQGKDAEDNEKPAHSVTVSDFYIGKYEVTQAQWEAVMGKNPSYFKGYNRPVENVRWIDIQEFIEKLNAKTGKKYRLPTEAEWEYAARGGNQSKGYKYSGSNDIGSVAWYTDNSSRQTRPVGQKQPNELGLYDMSGNVREWCSDRYGSYSIGSQTNPTGPANGSDRVLRGGSWCNYAGSCRVSYRYSYLPLIPSGDYGFRLVCQP